MDKSKRFMELKHSDGKKLPGFQLLSISNVVFHSEGI